MLKSLLHLRVPPSLIQNKTRPLSDTATLNID
jgi:hypothetical protein